MWSNCLFVALGGGLGAVGRYLLSLIAAPWSFPVMTLLTNFLGAVVIGAVAQAAGQLPMSKSAVLFYICKDICLFDVQHYNRCETKGVEKAIENVRKKLPHPN